MVDVYTINEELNNLLAEGDITITKKFRKKIIKCILLYDIPEENLEQILERIIDNRILDKDGKMGNPKKKDINKIIKKYLDESRFNKNILNASNEYIDNDINEQTYNGFINNNYQKQQFKNSIYIKPKTKNLKITYRNQTLNTEE